MLTSVPPIAGTTNCPSARKSKMVPMLLTKYRCTFWLIVVAAPVSGSYDRTDPGELAAHDTSGREAITRRSRFELTLAAAVEARDRDRLLTRRNVRVGREGHVGRIRVAGSRHGIRRQADRAVRSIPEPEVSARPDQHGV